ncbi:MAG: tetratricopeptide repeat protein [Alphaproteobacteria bacterium]|nr:tetratricopeptide repeat protein [Alphaproteobacteria bacterium]
MFEGVDWSVWGPPTAVAVVGLGFGLFLLMRGLGEGDSGELSAEGLTRDDLQARKDARVEELRALQAEQGRLPPDEFDARWRRTLDDAARALRDLEHFTAAPTQAAVPAPSGGWSLRRQLPFVVLAMIIAAGATWTLMQSSRERGSGGMTGATVDSRQAALEEAKAALEANPQDIDAAAFLAHSYIRDGDLDAGMKYVDAGRTADPDDPRIQASLAALMIAIGYFERAESTLDDAQKAAPDLASAWLWRGVLRQQQGDLEGAGAAFDKVLELSTDAQDRRLAAILKSDLDKAAHPVGPRVAGRVEIGEGVTVPEGALLFIYARSPELGVGPPLAALKVPVSQLPYDFTISETDMIRPGTWPDEVWVSARVDLDGNAMTKDEGAPASEAQGPITSAEPAITLTLR